MSLQLDFTVFDSAGQLAAIAEVTTIRGVSREWAAEFRRNLLEHGGDGHPVFFLIVTPDRIFLWKNAGMIPELVEPHYEINAQPVFKPYFYAARINESRIERFTFEMIVAAWLNNLALVRDPVTELPIHERAFIDSGFVGAIRRGKVEHEVVV